MEIIGLARRANSELRARRDLLTRMLNHRVFASLIARRLFVMVRCYFDYLLTT